MILDEKLYRLKIKKNLKEDLRFWELYFQIKYLSEIILF